MDAITFTIPGPPVPQPRPKISTWGGRGRAYVEKDHAIHAYRQAVELAAKIAARARSTLVAGFWRQPGGRARTPSRPVAGSRVKTRRIHVRRPPADGKAKLFAASRFFGKKYGLFRVRD